MPIGLNLAQLNRISDPRDPYNLDAAMAESASSAVQGPQHPVFPPMRQERVATEGAIGGAEFAPSSIRPITERILTPAERGVSASAQGRAGTKQIMPSRPGEKELIERRQRERRGR